MAEESIPKSPAQAPMVLRPFTWQDFHMEFVMVTVLAAYLFLWWQGSRYNRQLARGWMQRNVALMREQFAWVGGKENKSALVKDGPADYLLYTSGRRNIQFAHWWLKLKPRNSALVNMMTNLLSIVGQAKRPLDQVTVHITLAKELPQEKGFVLAIVRKEQAKELRSDRYDIRKMTKESPDNPLDGFLIYTESRNLANELLHTRLGTVLSESSTLLQSLVISNLPKQEPEKWDANPTMKLSMTFALSQEADELVKLACELPDIIADLQLSLEAKSKVRKNREELKKTFDKREQEQRAEELANKKAEAKRIERENVKKLSAKEQRKWDEKERAREMKKRQKKGTKRA